MRERPRRPRRTNDAWLAVVLGVALGATTGMATPPAAPVCIAPDGSCIRLELAISPEERALGLMFRDSLAADGGMFFLFEEEDRHPFWMKNTFIPLDLVWLDGAGTVVEVRAGVQPCHSDPCPSYMPARSGRAVLEVNAGFARAHGIAAGTTLRCDAVPGYPVKVEKK